MAFCEDVLPKNDYNILLDSLESGTYAWKSIVEKYPNLVDIIFIEYIREKNDDVVEKDLEYFIAKGVDVNMRFPNAISEYGDTALLYACEYRNVNLMRLLLKHGADPNLADREGNSPLHALVVSHDSIWMVKEGSLEKLRQGLRLLEHYDAEMVLDDFQGLIEELCLYDKIIIRDIVGKFVNLANSN